MRNTAANVLRAGVMIAMVVLGVVVLSNRRAETEPPAEPPPRKWNALAPVVQEWRASPGVQAWRPPEARVSVADEGGARDIVVGAVRSNPERIDAKTTRYLVEGTDVATHAPVVLAYTVVDGGVTDVRVTVPP